ILVESALNGIVMVDVSGKILLANARFETQFGYEAGELIGQSVDALVPPRLRPRHPEHRSAFLAHPEVVSLGNRRDLVGLRKDGTEFPLSIHLTPLTTTHGVYVLESVSDPHGSA
ncbi:MAG: PAS domain S-box protein, partial [Nitrospira sp.]